MPVVFACTHSSSLLYLLRFTTPAADRSTVMFWPKAPDSFVLSWLLKLPALVVVELSVMFRLLLLLVAHKLSKS